MPATAVLPARPSRPADLSVDRPVGAPRRVAVGHPAAPRRPGHSVTPERLGGPRTSGRGRPAVGARRRVVRRRRVAALVFTVAALFGAVRAVAAFGVGPASDVERRPPIHVVQPGETLWSIAQDLQPGGDVRSLVRKLQKLNGGSSSLEVGQRLVVPEGLPVGG